MANFKTQQAKGDVSSSQRIPPTSSQGYNGRNKDGEKQLADVAIKNMEEDSSSDDNTEPPTSVDASQQSRRECGSFYTQHQIQEMERFFKDCHYPNENQRRELGNFLGLNSMQIMFWFRHKRAQAKVMFERQRNTIFIVQNEKLYAENLKYKEALSNAKCLCCRSQSFVGEMSFEEKKLSLKNAQLKEEIEKKRAMEEKYEEKPASTSFSNLPPPPYSAIPSRSFDVVNYVPESSMQVQVNDGSSDPQMSITTTTPFTDHEKALILELATGAMKEFTKMAHAGEPLWIRGMHSEIINQQEYVRAFPIRVCPTPLGFISEGSRESMIVAMNPINLIEILMDVNQWSTVFPGIISSARTTEILSTGVEGNYDRALQVISAEFHTLSHLVPTRDSYFLRYCKYHPTGAWVVVDISLDDIRPGSATRCRRRPSGYMIQEFPFGFSKVTCIEHVQVEGREVHNLFKNLVNSGFFFGARRWIRTLERHCERLAFTMSNYIPPEETNGITPEGRNNLMKLAQKIMQSYCNCVGASPPPHVWTVQTTPTGVDDVRIMTKNQTDTSSTLNGVVISVSTSFSLPIPSKKLFDFIRNENTRNQWDILTNGFLVQELAHISSGCDLGNFVSLLHASSENSSQSSKVIVQETCTDSTGSYMVYAPVEIDTMNLVLSGLDLDYGTLLPSGFAILPDGFTLNNGPIIDIGSGGCLGTLSYQMLVKETPTPLAPGLVSSLCTLIKCTIDKIQAAMMNVNT